MQLKRKEDINSNFIFRLGELRVVFAFLKVIGKYIENSGLDQVFIESCIYGPTTFTRKAYEKINRSIYVFISGFIQFVHQSPF